MLGQPTLKCTRSSHPPSPNHHPRSFECTCLRRLCRRWSFFCCPSIFLSGPSHEHLQGHLNALASEGSAAVGASSAARPSSCLAPAKRAEMHSQLSSPITKPSLQGIMLPQLLQSLGQHHFHSDQQKHPGVEWCMSSCPSSATSGSACGIASLEAACTGAHGNLSRQLLHMLASNSMHHLCRHLRVSLFGNGLVLRNSVGIFCYSRTLQGRWSTSVLASFYFFQSCILSFAGRLFMLDQPTLKCTRSSHPPSPSHHPRSFECTCLRRLCRRWSFFYCPSLFLSAPAKRASLQEVMLTQLFQSLGNIISTVPNKNIPV